MLMHSITIMLDKFYFHVRYSTKTALTKMTWQRTLVRYLLLLWLSFLILLDLLAALVTFNHEFLISDLCFPGLWDNAVKCIVSYLSGWPQSVDIAYHRVPKG